MHDPIEFPLVGYGSAQPLVLFLGQGDGDGLGLHFASPNVGAALLAGATLEDAALAEIAGLAQSPLEPAVVGWERFVGAGDILHAVIEPRKAGLVNMVSIYTYYNGQLPQPAPLCTPPTSPPSARAWPPWAGALCEPSAKLP